MIEEDDLEDDNDICSADGDAEDDDEVEEDEPKEQVPAPKRDEEKKAGDEEMGAWVYCTQHVRPHTTGWCTVGVRDKRPLKARNSEQAYKEVKDIGWPIFGHKEPAELVYDAIVKAYPLAEVKLDIPSNKRGVWWIEGKINDHPFTVSYDRERHLYGVSSSEPSRVIGIGEASDELYGRHDHTMARIFALARRKEFTEPPEKGATTITGERICSLCGKPHDRKWTEYCSPKCELE